MKLSLLPALALALVPKCPLCWAAWAGAGAALGLGRLGYRPWLLPALAVLLGVLLAPVAWRAWRRRHHATAILALLGGCLTIGGRLVVEHPAILWAGLAVLAVAALDPERLGTFVRHSQARRNAVTVGAESACRCDPGHPRCHG